MITDQKGKDEIVDEVLERFARKGHQAYIGEVVSQEEHALQAAWLAEQSGAPAALIAAALLHDIGHLLHDLPEDCSEDGVDDRHEELGRRFLQKHFPPSVSEPVRMHVAAKRYLCAIDPAYQAALSPASMKSLQLQGGSFTARDIEQFRACSHAHDAVQLRRWDDRAKVQSLQTPDLQHFRPYLIRAARAKTE